MSKYICIIISKISKFSKYGAHLAPLSIKLDFFWIQIQEAFYHETVLVHRPSGTNEIIDIIDKSSKHMDPKSIFSFIPQYLVSDCCLMPNEQVFSYIMAEQVTFNEMMVMAALF